ncbi:MAG: DUF2520 domain-containing protein [Xanthomonadales bacterium]|nr:DUF2520 domain-containing protein [Gammaproteobacteria bacterium]MBT8052802.1 DUF2520 domain-containing protein [Gammaproteobacteria bacterium]NNK52284.1 DUF2520 domain-containing protein [Xanthomonadales bacterium]
MASKINIIGCGQAAGSLARLWVETGAVNVGCVLNRSESSTRAAVGRVGAGKPVTAFSDMEAADFWLIGTNDDQIKPVAKLLRERRVNREGALVFHLAGRFGLDVLDSLDDGKTLLAALHPVRSLTHAALSLEDFAATACVAEGDPAALAALQPLVTSIGGTWLPVASIDRGLYHASVSIISNITKAVAWKAQKWQKKAGLPEETAATVTHQLLASTMDDLFRSGARQSITGPVVRGDTRTIEAHIQAINTSHPEDLEVYRVLARTVLELAQERGDLDEQALRRFEFLLGR